MPFLFISRFLILCALSWLALPLAYAQDHVFDRPAAIEPAVAFWKRIYTEVGTTGGLIHDDTRLDIVYDVMVFPEGVSSAVRTRRIEDRKQFIAATLRRLANSEVDLTDDELAVRSVWPADTTVEEFSAAADRVRFQLGQADRFQEGLARSGAWRDSIRNTFRDLGLPEELAALPHVESSFNTHAYSKVGAAGMWQFMPSTGKRFLRIDNVIDERLDPYKASVAAAHFMRQNFSVVQSWALAITAYNHGAAGMLRAKEQLGTDDIGEIIQRYQSKSFGFASRNFYACFLAALEVDSDPEKFFPGIRLNAPDSSQVMLLRNQTSLPALANSLQLDASILKQLNPSLMAPVWTGGKRIPSGFEFRVPSAVNTADVLNNLPSAAVIALQVEDQSHRVRKGETIATIAAKYGVSTQQLAKLNGLRQPYRVTVGKVLKLPIVAEVSIAASKKPSTVAQGGGQHELRHTVIPGDTLSKLAQQYSVAVSELLSLNKLSNASQIKIGQRLLIRGSGSVLANANEPEQQAVSTSTQTRFEKVEPKTDKESQDLGGEVPPAVYATTSADPVDYAVRDAQYIVVEPNESLSHYAEWLSSTPAILRSLNHLTANAPVQLGAKLKLDFAHASVHEFESKRLAFHQQMQVAFFAQYRIVDSYTYVMKKGDSIWSVIQKTANVPLWLLRQYNPTLALQEVKPGAKLVVPNVRLIDG